MIPYYRLLIVVLMNVLVNMCLYGFSIVFVAAQLSTNSALQSSEVLTAATYFQKPFPPHSAMTMEGGEHDAGLWQNCNLLCCLVFLLPQLAGYSTWVMTLLRMILNFVVGCCVSNHMYAGVCVLCKVSLKTGFEQQPLSIAQNWLLALSGSKSLHQ